MPSAVAPMNPWVTGMRPAAVSGAKALAGRVVECLHVRGGAAVKRSSVTHDGRMSTQIAARPAASSAAAISRELQSSPRPASASSFGRP